MSGVWGGWSSDPSLTTGGSAHLATSVWPTSAGDVHGSNASVDQHFGIFAKGHSVAVVGHHASIRIVPRNGGLWHAQFPDIFANRDSDGHYFATMGAGPPPPNDSTTSCDSYPLVSATNRVGDLNEPATDLERLEYVPMKEDQIILRLLQHDIQYRDDLMYCWSPDGIRTFNSNSYAAGLLNASSIPLPLFPRVPLSFYVGWTHPVPKAQFDAH